MDEGTATVVATWTGSAIVVALVGAKGNFILGEADEAAIVGCAGLCCRADNSANTSIKS